MGDSSDSVYRHYLMKRYWEHKNEYDLPKIIPYQDSHIDLETDPFNNPKEQKTQVSAVALERLIDRVLTNQAISMADGKDYYEDFESNPLGYEADKIPGMYKIQSKSFSDSRLPKKRTGSKNTRRSRSRKPADDDDRNKDLPEGSEVTYMDGVPMVTLSIDMLRRYMYIEVEARVRYINEYYVRQWDEINKEKLTSYAELIILKEKNDSLRAELADVERVMSYYKQLTDHLEDKVEMTKEAKRRRRQAKKQRKSDTPSISHSDTVSCTQVQSPQEVTRKECDEKAEVNENLEESPEDEVQKFRAAENSEGEMKKGSDENQEDEIKKGSDENPKSEIKIDSDENPEGDNKKDSDGNPICEIKKGSDSSPDRHIRQCENPEGEIPKSINENSEGENQKGGHENLDCDIKKANTENSEGALQISFNEYPEGDIQKGNDENTDSEIQKIALENPGSEVQKIIEENMEAIKDTIEKLEKEHKEYIKGFIGDVTGVTAKLQECSEGDIDITGKAFDENQEATKEKSEMQEIECDNEHKEAV